MGSSWMILGTWSFAHTHISAGAQTLAEGGSAMDAAVAMIKRIEEDPAIDSVGLGGLPGWYGEVDLDSAIMDGETLGIGGVGSLKGFLHPIEVARDVLTCTGHDLLVGDGAAQFAAMRGHQRANLLTESALRRWRELRSEQDARPDNADNIRRHGVQGKPVGHDTVGVVARDQMGHLCAATSTSGLALKLPGRVGDSPICGAGLYADDHKGAAAATGLGEDILRTALCYRVVDLMDQGISAQSACEEIMRRASAELKRAGRLLGEMAVIALDTRGGFGYAANHNTFCAAIEAEGQEGRLISAKSCIE